MKINKTWMVPVALGALVGLAGCNAISFFPRNAAERAADKVLDDILPDHSAQEISARAPEPKTP